MKNYFAILVTFTVGYFITSCHYFPHHNSTNKDSTNCCIDSCTISNNYCLSDRELPGGGYEVATADIRIDSFVVQRDGIDHLLLYIHVSSNNDDDAHEAQLTVLLPTDVCDISVINIDPLIKSYKQCGGRIKFCLGQLATAGVPGCAM